MNSVIIQNKDLKIDEKQVSQTIDKIKKVQNYQINQQVIDNLILDIRKNESY